MRTRGSHREGRGVVRVIMAIVALAHLFLGRCCWSFNRSHRSRCRSKKDHDSRGVVIVSSVDIEEIVARSVGGETIASCRSEERDERKEVIAADRRLSPSIAAMVLLANSL